MTHRDVPGKRIQRRLVEDLRDKAHVLVDVDALSIAGGDPRRFLAAVLQRVEAVVGEFGYLFPGRPHPEDTTGVLGSFFAGKKIMGKLSVAAHHGLILSRRVGTVPSPGRPLGASALTSSAQLRSDDGFPPGNPSLLCSRWVEPVPHQIARNRSSFRTAGVR